MHTFVSSPEGTQEAGILQKLVTNSPEMICALDQKGHFIYVSAACERILGYQRQGLQNQHFLNFVPPLHVTSAQEALRQAARNLKTSHFETSYLHKSGLEVPMFWSAVWSEEDQVFYCVGRDASQQNQFSPKLRQQDDLHQASDQANKLNTILESITDAFFTLDKDGSFSYTNPEFKRLFHLERENYVGTNIRDVFPKEIHQTMCQQFQNAFATLAPTNFEVYLQSLDLWLDVKAFPSQEGLLVYCRDVSEKVKTKQELEKLSLVANRASIGVVIQDAEGRIEWANEGFSQNTGFSFEEAVGKRPAELLHTHQTDAKAYDLVKERMSKGQPVSFELLIAKKNGEEAWHSVQVNPIHNQEGKLVKFVGTQTNINALKRSEIQLTKLAHDLCRKNQDLQQFSYIVSHNLRASVANALGLVDMLKNEGKDSEKFDTSLDYLNTSIYQLDMILRDLNLILSIRDKKAAQQKEQVSLKLKCQQALASHQESLDACQALVNVNLPDELWVHDINDYVYSIMHNLISNAIKYRSPGRLLEINIECLSQSADGRVIAFSDNGLGFDMQKVGPNIFKLYKKFHPGTEGRGIGLFLVKTQVEALGGKIEVTSQKDVGTRFLIHFK